VKASNVDEVSNSSLRKARSLEEQSRGVVVCLDAFFRSLSLPRGPVRPDFELTLQEIRTLRMLAHTGSMIMSDLAISLAIPISTATRLVDRLVVKGVVLRKRSSGDKRVVHVELSQEGKKRERTLFTSRLATARDFLVRLSPGEREMLVELMEKMTHLSRQDAGTASPAVPLNNSSELQISPDGAPRPSLELKPRKSSTARQGLRNT
jgi:DNA-binding MarR family transcriptional regulator